MVRHVDFKRPCLDWRAGSSPARATMPLCWNWLDKPYLEYGVERRTGSNPVSGTNDYIFCVFINEILIKNSTYCNNTHLKNRLLKEGLLVYKCYICGLKEWLKKPISLHLDHINGVNDDNRIENLRLLCPNCHSQTSTYAGKNIKIKSQSGGIG